MARRRVGVVLLVPSPYDREIDALRRALGDGSRGRVPAHLTLVPPVNVAGDRIGEALAVLRHAASAEADRDALTLQLGPPASFHPASPTLYLEVGDEAGRSRVQHLRDAVFVTPLERPLEFPFVPHVTIADTIDPGRADAARTALADFRLTVTIDRVHLLEEQRIEGARRWVPIADAPFVRPTVVGRGGIELELVVTRLTDPETFELLDQLQGEPSGLDGTGSVPGTPALDWDATVPDGAERLVCTARRRGRVVGAGQAWRHPQLEGAVTALAVAADQRGQGVGRQLRLALEARLA